MRRDHLLEVMARLPAGYYSLACSTDEDLHCSTKWQVGKSVMEMPAFFCLTGPGTSTSTGRDIFYKSSSWCFRTLNVSSSRPIDSF